MISSIQHVSLGFSDRFASLSLLGKGGEGAVFGMWDRNRKLDLALKVMLDTGEPGLWARFEHEYQILAATRSSRLVQVYDYGERLLEGIQGVVRPCFWYSMEKCDSSIRDSFPRMTLSRRVRVIMQMLDGIALLHANGIAHRDIKPDNLFCMEAGGEVDVKIGDFGIATGARVDGAKGGSAPSGSPPYAAPERWYEDLDADWRPADQYAAGVAIYEILSGGALPLDFSAGYRRGHERSRLRPLIVPELRRTNAPSVDHVLATMLAKQPEWRYADIAECKRELSAALALDGLSD